MTGQMTMPFGLQPLSENTMKHECQDCIHWAQRDPYQWGVCEIPLPWWAEDKDSPVIFPRDGNAEECDCFELKKESE